MDGCLISNATTRACTQRTGVSTYVRLNVFQHSLPLLYVIIIINLSSPCKCRSALSFPLSFIVFIVFASLALEWLVVDPVVFLCYSKRVRVRTRAFCNAVPMLTAMTGHRRWCVVLKVQNAM